MPLSVEEQLSLCLRLVIAAILSAIVGYNRERHDHPAGLRTHILVGVGAALFTVLSIAGFPSGDKERVASQIVVGIGFLGAGAIVQSKSRFSVKGMTTAAGIWAVSARAMRSSARISTRRRQPPKATGCATSYATSPTHRA